MHFPKPQQQSLTAGNPIDRPQSATPVRARNRPGRSRGQSLEFQRLEPRQMMAVDLEQVSTWGATGADGVGGVVLDTAGNVYTTGYFTGTVDFDPGSNTQNMISIGGRDVFVTKSGPQGNLIWARRIGGSSDESGISIHYNSFLDTVVTIGQFQGTIDIDPGVGTVSRTSNGENDIFVSLLSPMAAT